MPLWRLACTHSVALFIELFCLGPLSPRPVRSSAWPRGTTPCPLRSWPSLPSSRWKPALPTGGPNTSVWLRNSGRTMWTWPGALRPTWPCSYRQGSWSIRHGSKVLLGPDSAFLTFSWVVVSLKYRLLFSLPKNQLTVGVSPLSYQVQEWCNSGWSDPAGATGPWSCQWCSWGCQGKGKFFLKNFPENCIS